MVLKLECEESRLGQQTTFTILFFYLLNINPVQVFFLLFSLKSINMIVMPLHMFSNVGKVKVNLKKR